MIPAQSLGTGDYEGTPCVVQMLYKLSSERTRGPWIRRLFRYQEWLMGEGYLGLARELGSSRHFVLDHLRRVERLGLVRRTMVRVLVTRVKGTRSSEMKRVS